MILPYLTYIFFFLAGCSNAFMDTFVFRVDRSIFKHLGNEKLNPLYTHWTTKKIFGMNIDPWHNQLYQLVSLEQHLDGGDY